MSILSELWHMKYELYEISNEFMYFGKPMALPASTSLLPITLVLHKSKECRTCNCHQLCR